MKLSEIYSKCSEFVSGSTDMGSGIDITGVEYDSRKVESGTLFVAVKGYESDGHLYIDSAIEQGASAVLVLEERFEEMKSLHSDKVVIIASQDTRRALSKFASVFFGDPSSLMHITGITGTNGKTSMTYLLEAVYKSKNMKCGVMGTVNYRWPGFEREAPNTTPESRDIQEMLRNMYDAGVRHVVMEVSSHALDLSRVDDIQFDTAVFTNLTGEHLDFHGDMESYLSAKKKLFKLLSESNKKARYAVLNGDDEHSESIAELIKDRDVKILTYGFREGSDLLTEEETVKNVIGGLEYNITCNSETLKVGLKLAGRFQLYNSLGALGASLASGINLEDAIDGLSRLENVPGRFEVIDSSHGFYAVVDYAHTSDALLKLLQSIGEMDHERIITVFGCGGDRDRKKRPEMGRIAVEYSDYAIVTSDNPRTEDPGLIISDILKGIESENYVVEPERETAIEKAVAMAGKDDIIVIAGKGHEDYQIIGKEKIHFDDRETASRYINMRPAI